MGTLGWRLAAAVVAVTIGACAMPPAPLPVPRAVAEASFAIDVPAVIDVLAKKPATSWQDALFRYPPVLEARRANVRPRYGLKGTVQWNVNPGGAITTSPAYAKGNQYRTGPNPYPDDFVYAASNTGTVYKLDPLTGATVGTTPGCPPMAGSAVGLNAGSRFLYLLSTTGFFTVIETSSMAIVYSQKVSQSGFSGQAPFIDYSNGGGGQFGKNENVWALAVDGSLYRLNVQSYSLPPTVTVSAYPANTGTDVGAPQPSWATNTPIPYATAVTVGARAFPVVWKGRAYFGSTNGTAYKVDLTAAPTVASWALGGYTSAQASGKAIAAPFAFDFDGALDVDKIFVPIGDRLVWIDPRIATNTPVVSPPLLLDKVPPTAAAIADTVANFPYTTANSSYTASEWVAVSSASAPTPTRWGSGSAVAGAYSTGISCATVKRSPLTGNMWTGHYTSPLGQVSALTPAGAVVGTYNSTVANVNEICMDAGGNCYAAHGANTKVVKFSPAGAIVQTFTMPSGYRALWPQTDTAGNLWVTSLNNDRVVKFSAAGAVLVNVARNNAMCVTTDAAGNAYVSTDTSPGKVVKYSPAGAVLGNWTVGNRPMYVALEPGTGNIWTCNYGSNNVTKLSPAGAVLGTYNVGANQPWSIAFDADGLPWITCLAGDKVQKCSLTGAVLASYTLTGDPYEIAFDGNGDAWVSCADGLKKLYDLGNLADLFANTSFGVLGDGVNSYSFLKFRIPTNAYANTAAVSANVTLTAATTPTTGAEDLGLFGASPYLPATATLWTGWATAPNTDWGNRPSIGSTLATTTGTTIVKDAAYSFPFSSEVPVDQVNTIDATGGVYAFAHRTTSATKVLKQVGHWYSNTTAPGAAQRPTLNVTRATGATLPTTNGIRCQPLLDAWTNKVYVQSCNALFELNYASAATFRSPAQVNYNATQSCRAAPGPLAAGKYEFAPGNVLMTESGKVVVADRNSSTNRLLLNTFTAPLDTNDKLVQSLDINPATGTANGLMLYDYDLGSVYLTSSNNRVVRTDVF